MIFWQGGDGGLDSGELFFGGGFLVRVCCGVGGALLGELGRVGEGFRVARAPTVVIAREVSCDGENPGGEGLAGIVTGAVTIKADEGLLSEVTGRGMVRAHADDEADEAVLPTAHEGVHGGIVTADELGHVGFIFVFVDGAGRLHGGGRAGLPGAAGFA